MVVLLGELVRVGLSLAVVFGINVEALRVSREAHVGLYRSMHATVVQVVPIDAVKERVRLDGLGPATNVSQPPRPIHRA